MACVVLPRHARAGGAAHALCLDGGQRRLVGATGCARCGPDRWPSEDVAARPRRPQEHEEGRARPREPSRSRSEAAVTSSARPCSSGPEDGGKADASVVYRAYPGERPILRGGRRITGVPALSRARSSRPTWRPRGSGTRRSRSCSTAGQRLPLARYPNFDPANPYGGGWAFADGKPVPMYEDQPGEDRRTLQYKEADRRTWSRPGEVEVFVFPRYNWWNNIVPIASVDPRDRHDHAGGRRLVPDPPRRSLLRPQRPRGARRAGRVVSRPRVADTLYFWPPGAARRGPRDRRAGRRHPDRDRARHVVRDPPRIHPRVVHGRGGPPRQGVALHDRRQHDPQRRRLPPRRGGRGRGVGEPGRRQRHLRHRVARDLLERRRPRHADPGRQLRRQQLHPPHRRVLQAGRGHRARRRRQPRLAQPDPRRPAHGHHVQRQQPASSSTTTSAT